MHAAAMNVFATPRRCMEVPGGYALCRSIGDMQGVLTRLY